jgi:hypothetical protein
MTTMNRQLCLTIATLITLFMSRHLSAQDGTELQQALRKAQQEPWAIEVYYEVRDGYEDEFLELYKRNHWPVLQAEIEDGSLVSVDIDTQWFPPPGKHQWDFRVTMVFSNLLYRHELLDRKQDEIVARLFPDMERFEKEERRRFDLVDVLYIVDRKRLSTADW